MPPVLFTKKENIAIITLNRPDRRNAINQDLLIHLYNAIETLATDDKLYAGIITGNGPSFCSGLDLKVLQTDNLFNPRGDHKDLPDIIKACTKPIIGAINGHAITGGFEIALNCDFLIASENASFADTHLKVGIHPGWGMTQHLQAAIGIRRARQMSYTAQFISAKQAYEWGLVNEVVPHGSLMDRAEEIAGQISLVNQDMLPVVKSLINYQNSHSFDDSFTHERAGFKQFVQENLVV
ncbi:Enoyl-CoA hydratase [Candidatus Magnetomorum sp. HK-1]|nr:Enoyl-CoA hydratase [Candidatus Magnetomorum sp. HK-1]